MKFFLGGGVYWIQPVCLSVCLSPVCGHDFVQACSKKRVHDILYVKVK